MDLGPADPAGRQRRTSLAWAGPLADVTEVPLGERGVNSPLPRSRSKSTTTCTSTLSQGLPRRRSSVSSIPTQVVLAATKGAASAPPKASSRRSSLQVARPEGVVNAKRMSQSGFRKAQAPKSYREDEEAVQLARDVFDFFDADGSGMLDFHELDIAQQILQSSPLDSACAVSDQWANSDPDLDCSGDVDLEEWAGFMDAVYQILGRKQFISFISAWLPDARSSKEGALRIQAKMERAAALKIQTWMKFKRLAAGARGSLSQQRKKLEHRLTTVGEVWELLTRVQGTYGRTMTVGEFVDVFRWARDTGLDTQLALTAPVTDENGTPGDAWVEDVLPLQVGRLCEMALDGDVDTLTDGEVWFDLAITKSNRLNNGLNDALRRDLREREFGYRQFCRIIPILARALSLDMQVLLSHISWLKTRVFEAPAPLLALFVQQCANHKSRQHKEEAYRGVPDVSILDVPFSLIDHVKLCRSGQIGLLPGDMQDTFYTVSRRLQERLAARMEIRKEANPRYMAKVPTIKKPGDDEQDTFVGAEAFQVLIEELFRVCPAGKFVSPLAMLVYMIRQGTENPVVSEETIAADTALARRLTLSFGQKVRASLRFSGAHVAPTTPTTPPIDRATGA
jgi:hypothetical protein